MRRDRTFTTKWRGAWLSAVLAFMLAACAGSAPATNLATFPRLSETPYSGEDRSFEVTVGRVTWEGRIIGLVDMPRQLRGLLLEAVVSPDAGLELPKGRCVALLGEITPLGTPDPPDSVNLPWFWLSDIQGGSPIGGSQLSCDRTEVIAAGYGHHTGAVRIAKGESYPFFMPYYIEGEIPRTVVVSISSLLEEDDVTVETSGLFAVPPITRRSLPSIRLVELGDPDAGNFTYSQSRGTDTLTWSGRIEGLIEVDVFTDVQVETTRGWVRPSGRCIAVVGSAILSYGGAERPEWIEWSIYSSLLRWPVIGLVVGGRVVSIPFFSQCPPIPFFTTDPDGVTIEDTIPIAVFFVPHEAEIEGVVVDPWGDETAVYEAAFLDTR